jgi:prepilin-type N-terminal cleavage/methylation domain-containing protein
VSRRFLHAARSAPSRGYTMIEVMMGLAVLAVGASGVIALQKITVAGVTNGRNITVATSIAQAHLEAVRVDATRFQGINPATTNDDYLEATLLDSLLQQQSAVAGAWLLPTGEWPAAGDPGFGVSDITGQTDGAQIGNRPVGFCTHVRLVPIIFDPNAPGGRQQARDALLTRVEVRTFWAKSGRDVAAECTAGGEDAITDLLELGGTITINTVTYTASDYGWVFLAGGIRPNEINGT